MATHACVMLAWDGFRFEKTARPWIAQINGFCPKFDFERKFCTGRIDMQEADKKGRGVRLAFYLPPGMYEICRFGRGKKYEWVKSRSFVHVSDGVATEVSKRKVSQWLEEKNRGWASASSTLHEIG